MHVLFVIVIMLGELFALENIHIVVCYIQLYREINCFYLRIISACGLCALMFV